MNIKLNEFVKRLTFGYYTVFMKDDIRLLVHVKENRHISIVTFQETSVYMTGTEFQEKYGDDIIDVCYGINTPSNHRTNDIVTQKLIVGSMGTLVEYGYDEFKDFFVSEMYIDGENVLVMTYYTDKNNIKTVLVEDMEDQVMSYHGVQI